LETRGHGQLFQNVTLALKCRLLYLHKMAITWDEAKRTKTLAERGLDFADAGEVLRGDRFTRRDDRRSYGEVRYITAGYLGSRFVVIVWTQRGDNQRIISMRYGHEWEEKHYETQMDRS
jgi:uncharacterized DUF497 family protein